MTLGSHLWVYLKVKANYNPVHQALPCYMPFPHPWWLFMSRNVFHFMISQKGLSVLMLQTACLSLWNRAVLLFVYFLNTSNFFLSLQCRPGLKQTRLGAQRPIGGSYSNLNQRQRCLHQGNNSGDGESLMEFRYIQVNNTDKIWWVKEEFSRQSSNRVGCLRVWTLKQAYMASKSKSAISQFCDLGQAT